jgi:hypothetical protein
MAGPLVEPAGDVVAGVVGGLAVVAGDADRVVP